MTTAHDYGEGIDPESALKYAIQHHSGDRTEIVEGVITHVTPSWDHENAAEEIRDQLRPRVGAGLRHGVGQPRPSWLIQLVRP